MSLSLSIQIAIRSLSGNKLRTFLTMLGIIIGVAAVIALVSIGRGAQAQVTSQIQSLGSNLLFIRAGSNSQSGVRGGSGTSNSLTYDDAEALSDASRLPSVVGVAPEVNGGGQLVANGTNWSARITGTTPDYEVVRNFHPKSGDFLTRDQMDSRALVAVLGSNVATNLFGDADPIGQSMRVNVGQRISATFRVIGVMESKGGTSLGNQDDQIFIPITTFQSRLQVNRNARGAGAVNVINVQVAEDVPIPEAIDQVAELIRERHRVVEDDFTIQSQEDFLNTFSQIAGTFTLLLGSIAGISLVVGGIGIMNIMLVSVTERTREIGIRKAVGARRKDILSQFLVEAVVVCLAGGAIGVGLGWGVSQVISGVRVTGVGGGQALQTMVTPDAVLLAFGVSALVGIFFGMYPASQAARLNPIEALRYE